MYKGFTVIEFLILIVIIGILIAMAIPFASSVRQSGTKEHGTWYMADVSYSGILEQRDLNWDTIRLDSGSTVMLRRNLVERIEMEKED